MVEVTSNICRSSDEDHLLVLGVFLISGFLSGLMFGWLVNKPELQLFFQNFCSLRHGDSVLKILDMVIDICVKINLFQNREASLVLASQGWRETFSLDSYCPHPSNHTPIEAHFTGLIESVNATACIIFLRLGFLTVSSEFDHSSSVTPVLSVAPANPN